MRGAVYHTRKIRLFMLLLSLSAVWSFSSRQVYFIKNLAERKISEFLGGELVVRIGNISGGILGDVEFKDVEFSGKAQGKMFTADEVEVSYRLWERREDPIRDITVNFDEDNPFLNGFIKLHKSPGEIEIFSYLSTLFSGKDKKTITGSIIRRTEPVYDCDLVLDGKRKISGTIDAGKHYLELDIAPGDNKKGAMKLKADVNKNGKTEVYCRLDQVSIGANEIIGDIWLSYDALNGEKFSLKGENIVVDKRPFLDIKAQGRLTVGGEGLVIEELKWGESITVRGSVSLKEPHETDITFSASGLDLVKVEQMFSDAAGFLSGQVKGEITAKGPLKETNIAGRIYVGEGRLGEMDFRSLFATLDGKFPVVGIKDSRVIKDQGYIIVNGEMDFSRMSEGKAFDGLVFETDNRVAVWEDWQISKEEDFNVVEASKDRLTFTTSMENKGAKAAEYSSDQTQKELGFKYKLDETSSVKLEMDEETDFFGVEHKIQF